VKSEIEEARVGTSSQHKHPSLFPASEFSRPPRTPQEVCGEISLNWFAALKLYEDGWLSFDPKSKSELNESQEVELLFIGYLVLAGCDGYLLKHLLSGLQKPYSYRMNRVYYDWVGQAWRLLEDDDKLDAMFEEWLEQLIDSSDSYRRESIRRGIKRQMPLIGKYARRE